MAGAGAPRFPYGMLLVPFPAAEPREADADRVARSRVEAEIWEPAARELLAQVELPPDARVLDVGCGALGWLRVLGEALPDGTIVGTDVDAALLGAATESCEQAGFDHVRAVCDDLFRSALPGGMFDLVHARLQLGPLGRPAEQLAAYRRLLRPGGVLVLEDADTQTWRWAPRAPSVALLVERLRHAYRAAGGDLDMGLRLPDLLRGAGAIARVRTHVFALEPGDPYLRLPLQLADEVLTQIGPWLNAEELDHLVRLRAGAEAELDDPQRRGTTFTLVQAWANLA
jgi:SAM-dependent methyltransferase